MAGLSSWPVLMRHGAVRGSWWLCQAGRWLLSRFGALGVARMVLLLLLLLASLLLADRCQTLAGLADQTRDPIQLLLPSDQKPGTRSSFDSVLSPATDIPALLNAFQQQSLDNGLRLEHLEYQRDASSSSAFEMLRVNMVLIGNADKLHGMLGHLLKDYPGLALVRLKLTRERIDTPDIEGRLTWLFYLKATPDVAELNR
jgi:hypothetical protein